MQRYNNWNVSYSIIAFFERALAGHDKVINVKRTDDILFTIKDIKGRIFKMLLLNEYCLGIAAVLKARQEFPAAEYIITAGNWNGYTREAKEYGRANNIGIFNFEEFMGAINYANPKNYCKKDANGNPKYPFRSA